MLINQNYPKTDVAGQKKKSVMSRSETRIKRYERKPSKPLMMCGLLKSRVRHREVCQRCCKEEKKKKRKKIKRERDNKMLKEKTEKKD